MSNCHFIHVITLVLGLSCTHGVLGKTLPINIPQDSVLIDDSNLERRSYGNLDDLYKGDDFIYERTVNDSGWWIRFKRWLSDVFKDLFSINSDAQASNIVDLALNLFYVILLILVVYFIVRAIINKEGKWIFGKSSNKTIIPVLDLENNLHQTDFNQLITDAEETQNFRAAIRYHYLKSLKILTDKGLIEYDVEKTNSDYVHELKLESVKTAFTYASYLYNYIWYGEFDIDEPQYLKARKAFANLNTNIAR